MTSAVPSYVPSELVWDRKFEEFLAELDDPFVAAARLHAGPDIVWCPDASFGRPTWIVTRHSPMQQAFIDYRNFSSEGGIDLPGLLGADWELIPIAIDPPRHLDYRLILGPFFTAEAVTRLDGEVRSVCDGMLDQIALQGNCEFIGEFANAFPARIFLALVGLPQEMAPRFLEWEHAVVRGSDNALRVEAGQAVAAYLEEFRLSQRQHPSTDLLRGLFDAEIHGRALSESELSGILMTMFLGGLDSVASALGWIVWHLARELPLQRQLRARPALLERAVDELLRAYAVVTNHRTVKQDVTFHGVDMRKGDHVLLPTFLAARDPRAHENPHAIDLERESRGLTFGGGRHTCLGMHLARREIRVALERLLARCEDFRIVAGDTHSFHVRGNLGIDRLPLAWNQARSLA